MGWLSNFNNLAGSNIPPPKPFESDPYWKKKGQGTTQAWAADKLGYQKLREYLDRAPGYTDEEQRAMYDQPAQATKFDETASLRRLNQNSAATGSYNSGGRMAGAGRVLAESSRTRAGLRQNVKVQAAQAALQDRYRQLEAMNQFVLPRLGMRENAFQSANQWGMGMNQLSWEQRKVATQEAAKALQSMEGGAVAAGACWIAEALWGPRDVRTIAARFYVIFMAPKAVFRLYQFVGPTVARAIRACPPLGWPLRPLFRMAANRGAARLSMLLP